VSQPGWVALAEAAERTASEMNPQDVASSLNALTKLEVAAAAVSPAGWAGLAEAAERTAREVNPQGIANTLHALGVLPAAAAQLSPSVGTEASRSRRREGGSQHDLAGTQNDTVGV